MNPFFFNRLRAATLRVPAQRCTFHLVEQQQLGASAGLLHQSGRTLRKRLRTLRAERPRLIGYRCYGAAQSCSILPRPPGPELPAHLNICSAERTQVEPNF